MIHTLITMQGRKTRQRVASFDLNGPWRATREPPNKTPVTLTKHQGLVVQVSTGQPLDNTVRDDVSRNT